MTDIGTNTCPRILSDEAFVTFPGKPALTVPVARTNKEWVQGLMGRTDVGQGMLFSYPEPHRASMWMKNTLVPLDMVFIDRNSRVTHVERSAAPHSLQGRSGGDHTCFVLETPAGWAAEHVNTGDYVTLESTSARRN